MRFERGYSFTDAVKAMRSLRRRLRRDKEREVTAIPSEAHSLPHQIERVIRLAPRATSCQ